MKLGIVGYGKMGRLVESLALGQGHEIAARFDSRRPLRDSDETRRQLAGVQALIDFSTAEAVPETVSAAGKLSRNLVLGTTGWLENLDEVRSAVEEAGIGVIHASNFSLGVHLFNRLVGAAARMMAKSDQYDVFVEESHHKEKRDRPSGTALHLLSILKETYGDVEIPISSLRAGQIPGSHTVGFDGAADSIRLEHVARSRQGFAEGALRAARWVSGRRGFFGLDQMLDDLGLEGASN